MAHIQVANNRLTIKSERAVINMSTKRQNKIVGFILLAIAILCGLILLNRVMGEYILTPDFIYPIALLLMFSGGAWAAFHSNPGQFMRIVLGWVMVFTAIIFGYNFYQDYKNHQIAAQTEGQEPDFIVQKIDNHFYTDAYVNNVRLPFMLDSGASMVVLTSQSAKKAGIDVEKIKEHVITSTANGEKLQKVTTVKEMRLGDNIIVKNIRVAVSEDGLDKNLLGNSFMKHISKKVEVGKELRLWK